MNKYNDSYLLTEIYINIKNKSKCNTIKDLSYFIKRNNQYNELRNFISLKAMIENVIDLDTATFINDIERLNFDELANIVKNLIKDIDFKEINYKTNRYNVGDYDYIEERLVKIVSNTNNIDR